MSKSKHRMKNGLSILLASTMTIGIVSACGKNDPGPEAVHSKQTPAVSGKASATPIEAKIHLHYYGRIAFDDNWEVFKKAAELTNVNLKGTASKASTNSDEAFNLMIASNDIPDVVHFRKGQINKFGLEGAFLPLDDLILKHAPNIKKYLDQNPSIRNATIAQDGKLYMIPFMPGGNAQKGWFIRQDWLDKLGLKQPNTVDELYMVLKAFKERDPNGNGRADEVGYFHREKKAGIYDLLSLWDSHHTWFYRGDQIVFGPADPAFKNAIINLTKWYKEGLIDKEIFTRGDKAREVLLGDNLGGLTHDWFASTAGYNDTFKDKVPGIKFLPFAPPANSKGKQVEYSKRQPFGEYGWSISAKSKYSVELIKYFDFWFTEEGNRLMNFGIEGKSYTLVNGKPTLTPELLKSANVVNELNKMGAAIEIGYSQNFEVEKQWANPIALQGMEMYDKGNYYIRQSTPSSMIPEKDLNELNKLDKDIRTYVDETLQKWVLGAEPIEPNYDKFQNRLKELGVERFIKLKQEVEKLGAVKQ